MDYTNIEENMLFFLGGALVLAILLRELHEWWLVRDARRSKKAIEQNKQQYYTEMREGAVKYVKDLYKEVGKR